MGNLKKIKQHNSQQKAYKVSIPDVQVAYALHADYTALNELDRLASNVDVILIAMLYTTATILMLPPKEQIDKLNKVFKAPGLEVNADKLMHHAEALRVHVDRYGDQIARLLNSGDGTVPSLKEYYAPRWSFFGELINGLHELEDLNRADRLFTALERYDVKGGLHYAAYRPATKGRSPDAMADRIRYRVNQIKPHWTDGGGRVSWTKLKRELLDTLRKERQAKTIDPLDQKILKELNDMDTEAAQTRRISSLYD